MANLVLVDDHVLLRNGLSGLVKNLGHHVLFEASNGNDFIEQLTQHPLPDIVLMDINMPDKDGYDTTEWLKINHPGVKVLALSMYDNEGAIIRMLKNGAKGYILKDSEPSQLQDAIEALVSKGFFYSELINGKVINAINNIDEDGKFGVPVLSERETTFLKFTCTELTYRDIADKMFVSVRTVDNYRDQLFARLKVKTRVGLVMYAIKNNIVDVK